MSSQSRPDQILGSPFWNSVNEELEEFDSSYRLDNGYDLLSYPGELELDTKSFESFLLKTYRKNILGNEDIDRPPSGDEWVLPPDWYERVDDIVRTRIIVRYLDGIEYLLNQIRDLALDHNLSTHHHLVSREEGYYSAHLYVSDEFIVPGPEWDDMGLDIAFEIQLMTQLQEAIQSLLHTHYVEWRKHPGQPPGNWQWEYDKDTFDASYLGHVLHYLDGKIVEAREGD